MGFSFEPHQGEAEDFNPKVDERDFRKREEEILVVIKKALADIVKAFGGHVAVSVSGNVNEHDDQPGDNVNLQVSSFLRPSEPTPDAGLAAAGGSARNHPPEASTAAPQPQSGVQPARQNPVPQPSNEPPKEETKPPGEPKAQVAPPAEDKPSEEKAA